MADLAVHHRCATCALLHRDVEAGGWYYCPNPLCRGPGGAWFRRGLPSYREATGDRHTVEAGEWLDAGLAVPLSDPAVAAARDDAAAALRERLEG